MKTLVGTGGLSRLILRRDRILLPLWVAVLSVIPVEYASANKSLYTTLAAREQYAHTIATNPTTLALLGPEYGPSIGALATWRALFGLLVVGLATLLTVIRHTRADEEAGRRELLGATVVGRHAPLAAALLVTFVATAVLGFLVALWMILFGLPVAGSFALGLSWTATGWLFAAVGGLAAQMAQGAGAARGIAIAVLGAAYMLRAAGDASGKRGNLSWLSWVSPFGWMQRIRPYSNERWWIFALALGVIILAGSTAFALSARRDVEAGIIPPRLGPASASPALRTPLALAWRLHRALLLGWSAGFAVYGLVVGASAKGVQTLVSESSGFGDVLRRLGGSAAISDTFLAALFNLLALAASAYAIQATLRLRAEETALRAEPVLATAVGRLRWTASHLVFGLLGPLIALVVLGLSTGLAYGLAVHNVGHHLPRVLAGALIQLPAVWLLSGIAMALFGVLPRLVSIAWVALLAFLLVGQFGSVVKLDQWVLDLSPFTHIPRVPGGHVTATPLVSLIALAAALVMVGLAGVRRRDVGY
jgi:ABC-2 type transport system permease protein